MDKYFAIIVYGHLTVLKFLLYISRANGKMEIMSFSVLIGYALSNLSIFFNKNEKVFEAGLSTVITLIFSISFTYLRNTFNKKKLINWRYILISLNVKQIFKFLRIWKLSSWNKQLVWFKFQGNNSMQDIILYVFYPLIIQRISMISTIKRSVGIMTNI